MTTRNVLTEGSLFHGILRLAGPLFLGALLTNLQSLIDLFWVGRMGSRAVAALALSGTVIMMLFPVIMGMSAGTLALIARAVGSGDRTRAGMVAGQSLGLSLLVGILSGGAGWVLAPAACRVLGAPEEVVPEAVGYLRIIFLGSFTMVLLFIATSAMQGAGNTVIPTAVMALANLLNLVLDPLLIFGLAGLPALGVRGAALATVLSQAAAAVILLVLLYGGKVGLRVRMPQYRPRPVIWGQILRIGVPGMGQMLSRSLMSLVLMRLVVTGGVAAVAAYGIGLRFHMITLMPAFALANAAATMVGQNLGAGNPRRAARAAWLATTLGMFLLALSALVLFLGAAPLVGFFDPSPEVQAIGKTYLQIVSPFYVFAAMAIILGRGLMGAGDTVSSMILTILALWGLQVPLALLLMHLLENPLVGIWVAIAISTTAHGILTALWFQTGRWKAIRV